MTAEKTIFMFPGQGSQQEGMGGDLFEQFPNFVKRADAVLGYSLKDLCFQKIDADLNQTQFTQPALYCVNALYAESFRAKGLKADIVMGHSLGEYNALLEAGVFDFETGLRLVCERASLMSQTHSGGMLAVIGLSIETVCDLLKERNCNEVDIANHNSRYQTVLSMPSMEMDRVKGLFQDKAKRIIPLNVSGAFHSRYMEEIKEKFTKFLKKFSFQSPQIPVIANRTAKPYEKNAVVDNLTEQLVHTVLWFDSLLSVKSEGAIFLEVGPGRVLKGLLKRLL